MDHGESSYRRYLKGEEDAFRDIVELHFDGLLLFVHGYVRDLDAAEDIVIDVFTQLVVHKNRFRFGHSLKTYLYMMARSRALDHLKHRDKLQMTELSSDLPIADEKPGPEEALIAEEDKKTLYRALSRLEENQRQALHLVYFRDLSCEEAAKVLKKSRKQIYNLLYRGKEHLRTILEKEELL